MTHQHTTTRDTYAIDTALAQAVQRYAEAHPRSREHSELARAVLPGGTTRSVLLHPPFPIRAHRASGSSFVDVDGHAYVDLLGNYSAGLFGHGHPAIAKAVHSALLTGANGVHNTDEVDLAVALTRRFPTLERVRFTNSGTEANVMAVATARAFTGRPQIMVFRGGYHGGVMSFPIQPDARTLNLPFPTIVAPYNDASATTSLIAEHADSLAGVLVEPMLGATGCMPGSHEFLRAVRDASRRSGALLIVDEVMTSRNGPHGMQDMLDIRADLMTLGKYLAGGMSFGAFGGRADVMSLFDPQHFDAMAAGRVVLDSLYSAEVAQGHTERGEQLRRDLQAVLERAGATLSATGSGSLMNFHGTPSPPTRPEDLIHADDRLKSLLYFLLLEHGYYMAPRGYLALSLAVSADERQGLVTTLEQLLDDNPVLTAANPAGQA
jgi:glutamate-1-semialdehyde 2,1-aminomutase